MNQIPQSSQIKIKPVGPLDAKIFIIGEAPGEREEKAGIPFIGASGNELQTWLNTAGILKSDCYITNVFKIRPKNNDLKNFCTTKKEQTDLFKGVATLPFAHLLPKTPISANAYIIPEIGINALTELFAEIEQVRPNIILALGNTALWALTGETGISNKRGTIIPYRTPGGHETKILPTYHPAAILRQWDLRTIAISDCIKLSREYSTNILTRTERLVYVPETIKELDEICASVLSSTDILSVDIETKNKQITCIGFSTSSTAAVVIPFYDPRKPDKSYWSPTSELLAWNKVRDLLGNPNQPKLGQNFLYDIQYLWRIMGIAVRGRVHDTMLLHHSMYPELDKGLGFLGSIYCNELAWKQMRPRGEKMEMKADE